MQTVVTGELSGLKNFRSALLDPHIHVYINKNKYNI